MKLNRPIFAAFALTLAGIGGAATAQAPMARAASSTPDDVILQLWANTNRKLQNDSGLHLRLRDELSKISANNIAGPSLQDIAAEDRAERELDRAALPLINAWLTHTPAAELPSGTVDKAFNSLVAQQAIHTKNVATVITNLTQAGLEDAALMYSLNDDLQQGGSLAGLDVQYAGGTSFDNKVIAVLDHYTGLEAGKIYRNLGIDIQIQNSGRFLDTDFKKKLITIPGWYLYAPGATDVVKFKVGRKYRQHAAEAIALGNPPTHVSDITYELPNGYGNAGHNYDRDQIARGRALSDDRTRDFLLIAAADRINAEVEATPNAEVAGTTGASFAASHGVKTNGTSGTSTKFTPKKPVSGKKSSSASPSTVKSQPYQPLKL